MRGDLFGEEDMGDTEPDDAGPGGHGEFEGDASGMSADDDDGGPVKPGGHGEFEGDASGMSADHEGDPGDGGFVPPTDPPEVTDDGSSDERPLERTDPTGRR